MKIEDIDPCAKAVADATRAKLEAIFTSVKLKRCLKGHPRFPAWEANWRRIIDRAVARAVAEYISSKKHRLSKPSAPPTVLLNIAPATKVTPPQSAAVKSSKRI